MCTFFLAYVIFLANAYYINVHFFSILLLYTTNDSKTMINMAAEDNPTDAIAVKWAMEVPKVKIV